jgi:hypothetical protein
MTINWKNYCIISVLLCRCKYISRKFWWISIGIASTTCKTINNTATYVRAHETLYRHSSILRSIIIRITMQCVFSLTKNSLTLESSLRYFIYTNHTIKPNINNT